MPSPCVLPARQRPGRLYYSITRQLYPSTTRLTATVRLAHLASPAQLWPSELPQAIISTAGPQSDYETRSRSLGRAADDPTWPPPGGKMLMIRTAHALTSSKTAKGQHRRRLALANQISDTGSVESCRRSNSAITPVVACFKLFCLSGQFPGPSSLCLTLSYLDACT